METERLALREATVADAPFVLELMNEPAYIQFIGDRGVRTVEQAEARIKERLLTAYAEHGFGLWMVTLKATGEVLGMCGLIVREGLEHPDIGYAYPPRYWGNGYAFEAASAVMQYAREVAKLPRVVAIVSPANTRSIRVLEKLGLRYERMITLPGDDEAIKLFA